MRRLLLIGAWDPETAHNCRSENLLRQFASSGLDVVLICLAKNRSRALKAVIRDSLSWKVRKKRAENSTIVILDPFLNYAGGIWARLAEDAQKTSNRSLKTVAIRILAPLGILRELAGLSSLLLFACFRLEGRFDACLGFGPGGALVGWLLKKLRKTNIFVYEDQDYEPALAAPGVRRKYTAFFENYLIRRADLVVTVGHRLKDLRQSQTGRVPFVVPNGVNLKLFLPSRERVQHPPTLVFVGNVSPWDGLDLTIGAIPSIRLQIPNVRLLIVGPGDEAYVQRLRQIASNLGLEEAVCFIGPRSHSELPLIFKEADIGLANFQPAGYREYSFPLKVVEYIAAGLPVVATEGTEAGDLVTRSQCGRTIPFTQSALVQAVLSMMLDPAGYERYRRSCHQTGVQFDWSSLALRERELMNSFIQTIPMRPGMPPSFHERSVPK
jgi:glycosyltransferase involved in cell wall biosynthesis